MSFLTKVTFIVLVALAAMNCKTKPFVPGESKKDFIRFGNGGGFTGAVTAYYLTEDGYLFLDKGDTIENIGKSETAWTKQMFTIPDLIDAKNKPYHNPGNRYFFIEYSMNGYSQNITWGGEPMPIPVYETWYKNLMHEVKLKNLTREKNVE